MNQRINIASGEDVFQYEPSSHHTYESFAARQKARMEAALRTVEGSVNEPKLLPAPAAPPAVIYLRDESGFGPLEQAVAVADLSIPHDGTGYCGC